MVLYKPSLILNEDVKVKKQERERGRERTHKLQPIYIIFSITSHTFLSSLTSLFIFFCVLASSRRGHFCDTGVYL